MARSKVADMKESTVGTCTLQRGHWTELTPETAYRIAQLRYIVFTMEQGITTELDLDGVDLAPTTQTYWIQHEGLPVSTLRTLRTPEGQAAIGRVATHPQHRHQGLAGRLMNAAMEDLAGQTIELHAQAYLEGWYRAYGFETTGPIYEEAGLPHVPMVRQPR